jgi:predicted metal-dependent peptidase
MEPHIIHNYATDLAINSDIPEEELPEGGLIPGVAFKELTEEQKVKMGDEAVARYERVSTKIASLPKGLSSEEYFSKLMEDPQVAKDITEGQKGSGGDDDGDGVPGLPGGMDDHDGWDELSDEERELVKGKIAKAVSDAVKESDRTGRWGSVSAGTRQMLRERISKEVDWRAVLRKFCGMSRRGTRTTTWTRINTVHIHPKWGPLSTAAKRGYTSSIAIYIDQSGSVGDQELELAFAELRNLARRTEFTTFHFDTEVDEASETAWKRGKAPSALRTRFGGTDFECVTKHANKNSSRFDGYIIITDGEACKPSSSRLKRGWLLVPGTKLLFDAANRDFVMKMKHAAKKAA